MALRRFGPVQGAGVAVRELEGEKIIAPAALGVAVMFGKLRKGDVGKLIHCPTRADMVKKVGDYVSGSEVPDAAFDFWNMGEGAGELYFVRLTDGTEVASFESFFSRHLGHGYRFGSKPVPTWDETKRSLLKVAAKNGGRWGGRKKVLTGSVAVVATDITATTVITGVSMLLNQWAGATLRLKGVTAKTYEVVSNTTAGIVTVKSDARMATDLAAGAAPTEADWELVLDTEVQSYPTSRAGTRRALSVVWKDGEESETSLFGLDVYEDGVLVLSYPNLSMDPASKWYAPTVINEDTSNFYVTVTDLFGSGTYTSDLRPANFYGAALDWASDTMTAQIVHVRSVTSVNANVGSIGSWTFPSPNVVKKQRITLTFTSATNYTVTSDAAEGAKHGNLPAGTAGTAYSADNRHVPGWMVTVGDQAWSTGDVIVLDVLPFPVSEDGVGLLAGGWLYPDQGSDRRKRFQIKSNTANTITLATAPSPAITEATKAGTSPSAALNTGTLTFPLTVTDASIDILHSHFGKVSLTLVGSPFASAAALAAAINTAWQSASSSSGTIASVASSPATSIDIKADDSGADPNTGYDSFVVIGANGSADLGLAAGEYAIGSLGAEFRIEAPTELAGGYDGGEPAQAQYLAAAQPANTSLISRLMGQNKGLVKLTTPGWTDTTTVKAFLALAEAYAYEYDYEIPSNTTDDSAAIAHVNDTIGRNDFGVVHFPSFAYVPNPQGNGNVLRSQIGAILGREAKVARAYDGYHKVPAGTDVTLPNIVKLPTDDRVLNEEILNAAGINVIKKIRGNFVLWGARTTSLDPAWKFVQQRRLMSHYERILLENMDFLVFALNNPATQGMAKTTLTAFFLPEWQKGALLGDKFPDACRIKIDASNNTNLTRAAGDMHAGVTLRLAETVERFIISIGKAGIFEDLAAA